MKKRKLLSIILAIMVSSTAMVGCNAIEFMGEESKVTETNAGNIQETKEALSKLEDDSETKTNLSYAEFPDRLVAEKIGSIEVDNVYTADGGIYYKTDNGKYGVMSLDGKNDTGAKYDYCQSADIYFLVTSSTPTGSSDVKSLNCVGVIDCNGKTIVPEKYASIKVLNERYIRVCEVIEQTNSDEDALVYYTDRMISLSAEEGDTLYKGNWYIYDIKTGEKVNGVSGTKPYNISAYGNYLEYTTDDNEKITINANGNLLPKEANLFSNGYYSLVKDNQGEVYDSNDKKLFSYDLEGFVPSDFYGEYILASKYDDSFKYVYMDVTGKVVSAEFDSMPMIYGDLVYLNDMVFDLQGNKIVEGTYSSVYYDDYLKNTWFVKNGVEYVMIKSDGSILYSGNEDDDIYIDTYHFTMKKKMDDKDYYYCIADKDYTLEGYSHAPWLVEITKPNYIYDVVDSISGETIINGYSNYKYATVEGSCIYVYAEKADGGYDVYSVK